MSTMQKIIKDDVKLKYEKMQKKVIRQMMNPEKNNYDKEVSLPEWTPTEKNLLNTGYEHNKKDNTPKNIKRRQNRLNKLGEHLKKDEEDKAITIIKDAYHISKTNISICMNDICAEKTARKLITGLFKMIGHTDKMVIPEMCVQQLKDVLRKWLPNTKTVYACSEQPENIWKYINDEETVLLVYETYLLIKQMILIECVDKEEYIERTKSLNNNKHMKAVYAAAKELL